MEAYGLGPTTDVKVNVSATVTLPLHLKALESLEDAALQEEIMKEAVRLAIAEKLGGFDKMHITVTHKHEKPLCEAKLDLADLCCAIANVQHTYEHVMTQLLCIQELIQGKTLRQEEKISKDRKDVEAVLASIEKLLQQALEGPGEAPFAASIRERAQANSATARVNSEANKNSVGDIDGSSDDMEVGFDDRPYDPLAEGYEPLLERNNTETDDQEDGEEEEEGKD